MQFSVDMKSAGFRPLIGAVIVVIVGTLFVGNNVIWAVARAGAEAHALSVSSMLFDTIPEFESVISGEASPHSASALVRGGHKIGNLERFRVYDADGVIRMDSAQKDFTPIAFGADEISESVTHVLAGHGAQFQFRAERILVPVDGQNQTNLVYIAHTAVELVKADTVLGVLEVVSDETQNWSTLQSKMTWAGLQFLCLVALAFALPGYLYLRRTGQLNFAKTSLQRTADYDSLTGTLNRAAFTGLLRDHIATSGAKGMGVALHFIDLDRFKNINDALGHSIGDKVLAATAERLRKLLGTRDRLARLGADEFAILQPFHPSQQDAAAELARSIAREFSRPLKIDHADIQAGVTIGYACYPEDGANVDELTRAADVALSHAKRSARGKARSFDPSMERERRQRQHIEERLHRALSRHEFTIAYQPLYSIDGATLRGFEALLRLRDDDGTPISPELFIPVAEEMGLIGPIGQWVLEKAASTACEWPEDTVVSVNLSPLQFQSHDMPVLVRDVLSKTGLPANRLELEVTESVLIIDTEKVLRALRAIKSLGVSIALDDFGTGYSSLGYLWSFPFDKLKVDKSFMNDLEKDGSKSREILATIVALGKVLDLKVTAEGVETPEQAEVLRALDCDLVQGFLFGRPLDTDALAALLAERVQKEAMERASQRLQRGVGKTAIAKELKSA